VPNIVGRLDRYGEIIRDGESAVLADINPTSVSDAILKLLSDPALARRIAEEGRKLVVAQASFPRDVDRVEHAYYTLLDRKRRIQLPRPQMLSDVAQYWLGG
jgi:glycosyltransferase involved in cell wall biosynthesis